MSRSRKHRPFAGITTAVSEKRDKRLANRRHRRANAVLLDVRRDGDGLRAVRETSDVWCMGKDGKCRFDECRWPKLMRK